MRQKKILCLLLSLIILVSFFSSCSTIQNQSIEPPTYSHYKEIPGVTDEDINAVETILKNYSSLNYGVSISTEAYIQGDGSIGGFASLLCSRLSELFGITFVPNAYSWDDLIENLDSGALDFTGELTPTPERLKKYFMTDAIVQRSIKIFSNKYAEKPSPISSETKLRIAFLEGSNTYYLVKDKFHTPYEAIFVPDEHEIARLLETREIDAYIEENIEEAIFDSYSFVKIEDFYPLAYSPVAMTTAKKELQPIINIMQKYITSGGSFELTSLYNSGINDYYKNKLISNLTEEEKQYISLHNTPETAVIMGAEMDNYPASFYNTKDNEFQGIAIDILNQVSELTGLCIKIGNDKDTSWTDIMKNLENGTYSIVSELIQTNNRKGRFLWTEEPFCTDYYALLSRADFPPLDINQVLFSKVGLIDGAAYTDVFNEWFPDSGNVITYATTEGAIKALEEGEVDLLMGSQNLLLHVTNFLEKTGLKENIVFDYSSDSYFGLNIKETALRSIINKAQQYIDTYHVSQHWKRTVFDYSTKMLKDIMPYLAVFSSFLCIGLFTVFYLLLKNRTLNRNLQSHKDFLESEIQKRTHNLLKQDKMLLSVNDIAKRLLAFEETQDFDELVYECLKSLGGIISKNRVYIWKDVLDEQNRICCIQVYEWINGVEPVQGVTEYENIPYDDLPSFRHALDTGKCLNSLVCDLSESEKQILEPQNIQTILIAPIIIDNQCWGFIGVDNCETCQLFSDLEENMLLMSGFLLASAIQRRETQAKMREAEERALIMLNATPLCCNLWDASFNNIACNDEAVRLFGLSSQEEYLIRFFELSPKYQPCGRLSSNIALENITKAFEEGYCKFEWMHQKLNGEPIPSEITLVRIKYKNNYIVAGYTRDLREQKAMLAEINKAQADLVLARDEALAHSRAKSEFLAKMSHEIRTPMNAIVGMSELVLRESISPSAKEHAIGIKQASANLLSIINDILDFSKIESGKLEIMPDSYMLSSLINDVISIIRVRVMDNPILFVANIDSNLPNHLIGDEIRIRQILLNLLSNAVKYTKEGYIALAIDGEIIDDSTVVLTIEISDTGIGIKEDEIGSLFGEFVQADISKNKGVEGTGLGLAITKNLCKAMGGDVTVSSIYGSGSVFTVKLPQTYSSLEKFASIENPEAQNVLIYEPREIYATSIVCSIDNLGVRCTAVSSQSQLYEALENDKYTFVFVSSFLFETVKNIIEKLGVESKLVVLAEYGEATSYHNVRTIAMPVHSISVANVLNDINEDVVYNDTSNTNIRFIAPTARILIVDDINTNLKVAEGLISPFETRIDTCESGMEAIDLVKSHRYDIVFMDHMMPVMNGVEATLAIRELDLAYAKDIPIIALTANAVSGVKEMFLANGFNDFLAKPIEMTKLAEILEKWIPKEKREKYVAKEKETASLAFEIEGIDVKLGISLTGGTLENYLKILSTFHKDGILKLNDIKACLESNNITLYTTHVHALKSALASIGATKLSDFAKSLEFAGKNENISYIQSNNDSFMHELEILLDNISYIITKDNEDSDEQDSTQSSDWLKDELIKLKAALDEMDAIAADHIINGLSSKQWGRDINETIEQISQHILLCDYDDAIDLINNLL